MVKRWNLALTGDFLVFTTYSKKKKKKPKPTKQTNKKPWAFYVSFWILILSWRSMTSHFPSKQAVIIQMTWVSTLERVRWVSMSVSSWTSASNVVRKKSDVWKFPHFLKRLPNKWINSSSPRQPREGSAGCGTSGRNIVNVVSSWTSVWHSSKWVDCWK